MAETIATKYVIEGESTGAQKALRDLAKESDKMKSTLEKNRETFATLAKVGTASFLAISAIVIKSVKDFGEAEKAQKQLEHAVLNVSHATRAQLKATSDLADELERKGVLDGDNIKMGLAQLSTFGLSNNAVRGLGKSLADLAVNQFGVNASGEQMSDTANTIAKALNGQFGVLEKSGIRFSEAQKKAIEFGTEMQKVQAINEGFAQNLKYTNDVALTTFEGQMAKAQVQMGNMSEAIGEALRPALTELLQKIVPVIIKITEWTQENPELVKNIVIFAGVLSGVVAVLGLVGVAIGPVMVGIAAMTGPIGLVIIALGLLSAAFVTNFGGIRDVTMQVFGAIKKMVDGDWDGAWKDMVSIAEGGMKKIDQASNAFGNKFMESFGTIMDGASDQFINGFATMMDTASNWFLNGFTSLMDIASDAVITGFIGIMDYAADFGANFIMMLIQGIDSKVDAFINSVAGVGQIIEDFLGFHSPTKKGPGKDADKWMPNFMSMLVDGINQSKSPFENTVNELAGLIGKGFSKEKLGEIKNNIREFVTNASGVFQVMLDDVDSQKEKLKSLRNEWIELGKKVQEIQADILANRTQGANDLASRGAQVQAELAEIGKELQTSGEPISVDVQARMDALNQELAFIREKGITEQQIIEAKKEMDKSEAEHIFDRMVAKEQEFNKDIANIQVKIEEKQKEITKEQNAYRDMVKAKEIFAKNFYDLTNMYLDREISKTQRLIDMINSAASMKGASGGNPGRASGGAVVAGRAYTVGEYGPETFVPAQGGRIANASDTARGGDQTITIEINNPSVRQDSDIQGIADAVENVLIKRAKNFTFGMA